MAKSTKIEYCDSTANPLMGCDGCELANEKWEYKDQHCYAFKMIHAKAGLNGWPKSFFTPELFRERITKACKWKDLTGTERENKPWLNGMPRIIFWGDLGDMFTESVDEYWLLQHLEEMEASPHINMILTKRPHRMYNLFEMYGRVPENFICGTTVTSQATAKRASSLLSLMNLGGVHKPKLWLSLEPLLEAVELKTYIPLHLIDFVAMGFESGSNARHPIPNAARRVRDDCGDSNVPLFFKQWGEWKVYSENINLDGSWTTKANKVGKANSGKLLDGVEHTEMFEWRVK